MIKGYDCKTCNFYGVCKRDLDNHKLTNKHNKLTKTIPCTDCLKMFDSQVNLSRHKRFCNKTANITSKKKGGIKNNSNSVLVKDNKESTKLHHEDKVSSELEKRITNLEQEIKCQKITTNWKGKAKLYKRERDFYKKIIADNSSLGKQQISIVNNNLLVVNKNVHTKTFLMKNFIDAPDIYPFTNFLDYIKDEEDLTDNIIQYYQNGKLDDFISDMIIKEYKKENPKDQSLWNTDCSRLKYVIKQTINNSSQWSVDIKNNGFGELLIKPILSYIKTLMQSKIQMESINLQLDGHVYTEEQCREISMKMQMASKLIIDINNKSLANKIIKKSAESFYFDKGILSITDANITKDIDSVYDTDVTDDDSSDIDSIDLVE